jgi:hypothetical protein
MRGPVDSVKMHWWLAVHNFLVTRIRLAGYKTANARARREPQWQLRSGKMEWACLHLRKVEALKGAPSPGQYKTCWPLGCDGRCC